MQLEQSGGRNKYLAWQQKGNIFAAVDRFNVVSFWNTLTSKLIYKKMLEGDSRIQDAELFRSFDIQNRYEDPSNLFDQLPQAIVSFKTYPWWYSDTLGYDLKLVKLDLFVESQTSFDASCRTLISGKMHKNDVNEVNNPADALDYPYVYFYNEGLNCIVMKWQ